jgi:hypothetical protein
LRGFLHVEEPIGQADAEHPTQGWLPFGKLDAQPPEQLWMDRSSLASFAITDSCAGVNTRAVGDRRRDATRFSLGLYGVAAGSALCSLALCFGATTVMVGSGEVAPVSGFDIAVPLRPHSNAIDEMTVRGSDTFIAITRISGAAKRCPGMDDSMSRRLPYRNNPEAARRCPEIRQRQCLEFVGQLAHAGDQ